MLAAAGVGSAAWHPIAAAAMVEHNPARRAQLIGIHAFGGTLAEVGAPVLAGFLLASLPWQTVLQLSALPALVMGVVFLKLRAHLPRARHPQQPSRLLLRQPPSLPSAVGFLESHLSQLL